MTMKDALEVGGNACCYVLAGVQTEQTFRIISLVLSILISIIILIGKIIEWYDKAKKDGKITKEEIKELVDTSKDSLTEIADEVVQVVEAVEEAKEKEG